VHSHAMHARFWSAFCLFLLVCSPAFSQSNLAVFGGTTCDPQGRVIANAMVQLTFAATHAMREVTSDARGNFEITGLMPGDYEVAARAPGFAFGKQTVRLEVGQRVLLDLVLRLESLQQTVVVSSRLDVLRTTDARIGESIEPLSFT